MDICCIIHLKPKVMKFIALLYFVLFTSLTATSQNTTNDIDGLFSQWQKPNNPGGVVLISHKNQLVYSKTYGLANIPYNIPINFETVFNIGSVSKQFTAMAIVLLQIDGKLSIDDDIQKYFPELPKFSEPITIRHLLHHTSGLRSSPEMFGLAGWRDGDAITNEDVYRYLQKQTSLNFVPGSEYMYSNTGYILLAKIVETISKQDFKIWMKENIFLPLKMNSTFIKEDYSKITSKIASSYSEMEPSFFKTLENNDLTYGASNVYSTGSDMLAWTNNYDHAPKEWQNAFKMLETLDTLHSGKKNNYAFGIIVDDFFGNRRIQHTGGIAGFESIMYSYPDQNLEIIILSNFTSYQLSKIANQISQLFLQNNTKLVASEESINPIILHTEILKKYEGFYWNDKNNYSRKIYVENDILWYLRSNNTKSQLIPITETEFQMGGINEKLRLKFDVNANIMTMISADNSMDIFEKYDDKLPTAEELKTYTGSYYSDELETTYTISLHNEKLYAYHSRFGEFEIQILKKDVLNWSGQAISKFKRNENGDITGLNVTMNRIRDLWFVKK